MNYSNLRSAACKFRAFSRIVSLGRRVRGRGARAVCGSRAAEPRRVPGAVPVPTVRVAVALGPVGSVFSCSHAAGGGKSRCPSSRTAVRGFFPPRRWGGPCCLSAAQKLRFFSSLDASCHLEAVLAVVTTG